MTNLKHEIDYLKMQNDSLRELYRVKSNKAFYAYFGGLERLEEFPKEPRVGDVVKYKDGFLYYRAADKWVKY